MRAALAYACAAYGEIYAEGRGTLLDTALAGGAGMAYSDNKKSRIKVRTMRCYFFCFCS